MLIVFLCQRAERLKVLSAIISISPFCRHLRKGKTKDDTFEEIADRLIIYGILEFLQFID